MTALEASEFDDDLNSQCRSASQAELYTYSNAGVNDECQDDADEQFRPLNSLEFPDRREERQRRGLIKYRLENGVPDVGGMGWRSRTGQLLKNQTFYASRPGTNLWDNPTHAGPKTWRAFHGPKLRADAQLMERLDRLDAMQEEWETKKAYVNTVRVQTLDRFYHQKVENEQKETASEWAPHRRARRELHKAFESVTADLDSMPMKELKKVLTPSVLHRDREAIRNITKRIQTEETWQQAWKQMEAQRRAETRADLEHRIAYNEMLMDLASQPPRQRDPKHHIPNDCTPRIEELAKPAMTRAPGLITQRTDFAGLLHVVHRHALEARFPGAGHEMAVRFSADAHDKSQGGWPPPEPPVTPDLAPKRSRTNTGPSTEDKANVIRSSIPVNEQRMKHVTNRQDTNLLSDYAGEQILSNEAPPAPDQRKSFLKHVVANGTYHPSQELTSRSDHTSRSLHSQVSLIDTAPPIRPMVYPVLANAVEGTPQRPRTRSKPIAAATPRQHERSYDGHASVNMPGGQPSLEAICSHLDDFDAKLKPVPRLGNFWMTPR